MLVIELQVLVQDVDLVEVEDELAGVAKDWNLHIISTNVRKLTPKELRTFQPQVEEEREP